MLTNLLEGSTESPTDIPFRDPEELVRKPNRGLLTRDVPLDQPSRYLESPYVLGSKQAPPLSQSNFHFIYYIYDGLVAANLAEKYKLNTKRGYLYLKLNEAPETTQPKNDIQTNINKFHRIVQYLEELQFSGDEMCTIYSVIAAILNLGEVRFHEDESGFAETENNEPLSNFSELLEVEEKKIAWALTNYCLVDGGKAVRKRNTCEEAKDSRDVLANTLYTRLVDYIVSIINKKLSLGKQIFGGKYYIKILDYPGFECFKQNHLSQLFVNCFNEQLHYHFLQRVFAWETMDIKNEGVKFVPISYYNNKAVLNELLSKPEDVLSIIDDASRKGHGGRYITNNIQNLEKTKVIASDTSEFSVNHYTGRVFYSTRNMPGQNRDFLSPELIDTMRTSENYAIRMFFTNKLDKTGNLCISLDEARKSKYGFIKKILRGGLSQYKKELVRQQLRALTIVETAKARKRGFPHRIPFPEFLRRYRFLAFDFNENVEPSRDNCRLLMVRLKMEGWALGKTKIFLKYYNEEYLSRLYETQVKKNH
ncbi:hypothetical protein NQ315_004951 [Exocentrus adspersus]|uniref:Myosin motor domain-containing protein n=1 Tax=Exocentrus adspersus TaxID=1586481 RepID=A0AAV8W441_9CUCU|nr:hypothetical protein NQ315_004951 [Exocentrus adspersus]